MRTLLAILAALLCFPALPVAAKPRADQAAESTRSLYLLLIRQARADGRPRAALAYLADFDRQHPGDRDARVLRVNCLLDLGHTEEAEAALMTLPASSADGEVEAVRGHVLAARGNWQQASEHYRAALAASPANPLTSNALGYAQIRSGHARGGVETLRAAADLAPANTVIRNNLLLALIMAGRIDEADAALRAMPDAAASTLLRAQLGDQAHRFAAAAPVSP